VWKRVLLLALLVGSAVVAWLTGLHEQVDVESLRALVEETGVWGPLVFVLLFGLEGLGVPTIVFLAVAIALWPPWLATLLNWGGAMFAGIVGFAYARYVGRDWVAQRLPESMRRFEARVVERELETVIALRLFFFASAPAHWALGLSPVGFRHFLLGSAIGYVPGALFVSYAGGSALEWLRHQPNELWMGLAGAFIAAVIGFRLCWRREPSAAAARD
jgi:uncharacterized membrane protein YdjX (TVP38/TMEM64 family)